MFFFFSRIKEWLKTSKENEPGNLYEKPGLLFRTFEKLLTNIPFDEESASSISKLGEGGVVVYALREPSQLNTMILYGICLKKGLPCPSYVPSVNLSLWQPFEKSLGFLLWHLYRLLRGRKEQNYSESVANRVYRGENLIIHVGESELIEDEKANMSIAGILSAQAKTGVSVFIVPIVIVYGRRKKMEEESILNILFGQTENTGIIRRLVTFLRYSGQVVIIPADPIDLRSFCMSHGHLTEDQLIKELRSEIIFRIDEERESVLGPTLKKRNEIIEMVLKDPQLQREMEDVAQSGSKRSLLSVKKEARKYLEEIVADYNGVYIELWYRVLKWLWNNIYDGLVVDSEGLVRVRNIAKKMPFVVVPCHRSHIDYLLLSYVFYEYNIQLPFIAAGINMKFGPFGHIFRQSGAFFIRRTFRGNRLYAAVFATYLKILVKEGLPFEFFIEGGRSRTGKMVMPKYGLLSMIISAFQEKVTDDLAIIPVYIGYDRVIEEKSYLQELGGLQKRSENTFDILKSTRILRKRFGSVYVNIGEPIFLKSYLANLDKSVAEMTTEERRRLYRKIGYEIAYSINRVSVVTPISMVSAALLSHDRRGISHNELMEIVNEFYEYLLYQRANLAATFAHREKAINRALDMFLSEGIISRLVYEGEEDEELKEIVYSIDDNKRMHIEYYKNNILHFFLPLSFVATSVVHHPEDVIDVSKIIQDYQFFKVLFWREFIFDDRRDTVDEVKEALSFLNSRGMLTLQSIRNGVRLEVKGRGRIHLRFFAGLIANYFESYWIVVRGCGYLRKSPRSERDWLRYLHKLGSLMFRKGEIKRAEALSQANFINAMAFLQMQGIITVQDDPDKRDKDARVYALQSTSRELEQLRSRIFHFM
ncbi:MAG: 1-acyl-sn-glycerol-3-phosphate acyltransferase [Syntrophales bacterium]|nr:1-acyl-sn-glycerol-3-phosphate acyltransferase [Syntrophales bacterium]